MKNNITIVVYSQVKENIEKFAKLMDTCSKKHQEEYKDNLYDILFESSEVTIDDLIEKENQSIYPTKNITFGYHEYIEEDKDPSYVVITAHCPDSTPHLGLFELFCIAYGCKVVFEFISEDGTKRINTDRNYEYFTPEEIECDLNGDKSLKNKYHLTYKDFDSMVTLISGLVNISRHIGAEKAKGFIDNLKENGVARETDKAGNLYWVESFTPHYDGKEITLASLLN